MMVTLSGNLGISFFFVIFAATGKTLKVGRPLVDIAMSVYSHHAMGFVMRKAIVYWSLGLISIGWLAGCNCLRNQHADSGGDKDKGTARVRKTDAAVVQPGPIDPFGGAKTPSSVKPGLVGPVKTPAPDTLPSYGASTPIAPPDRLLADTQKLPGPPPLYGDLTGMERKAPTKDIEPMRTETGAGVPPRSQVVEFPAPGKAVSESPKTPPKTAPVTKPQIPDGAAEKFGVVTGQVTLYRKAWRLRYAEIGQDDPYGGVLVLDIGPELSELRDGQRVRVRGTLVPPADRNGTAHYRVTAIEMLD